LGFETAIREILTLT